MEKSRYSLPVYFTVQNEFSNKDDRFVNVIIDVLHTGLNFNGSIFDKNIVDENIDSIKNTPILGFIRLLSNEKDFKGHEYILTKNEDGIQRKYIGSAYGLVPESCNPRWINKMCDDGIEREFLRVDALLWTKFSDATEILLRDIEKPHSMELFEKNIEGYEDDDENFHFTKFSFNGCCILGSTNDIEPAMINSNVEVQFTMSEFVKSIQNELNNKYISFTKIIEEKQKEDKINMPKTDFAQTVMQQFEDISNIVKQYAIVKDRWGDAVPRYYAMDIQDNEVIVTDRANNYQYYGLPFTMNGDKAEIDFTKATRKKLSYMNYEEGTEIPQGSFDFGKHIDEIEKTAFEKVTAAESKAANAETRIIVAESNYSTLKKDYDTMKPKYDEYVRTEQEQQKNTLNAEKDAMFARFEKELGDNIDFTSLKEKKSELSVEEIETKCSLIYTRKRMNQGNNTNRLDFSMAGTASVGIMDNDSADNDGVNYVSTKYGNIPVKR